MNSTQTDSLYKNYRNNQAAMEARVDHSWLRNSVSCAFERMHLAGTWGLGEPWKDVHILHRYGSERYGYLVPMTTLPEISY